MNKWIYALSFCLTVSGLYGQQKPQYTQYIFNNFLLNPALAGIENYTDLKAGHRAQWQGLEGAPATNYLSLSLPLGTSYVNSNANSFPSAGENPLGRSYTRQYQAAEPHHGIGLQLVFDKAGPINRTDLNAAYAYHLGLNQKMNLAAGIAAGFSRIRLDPSKIKLENNNDPVLANMAESQIKPDLAAGLWLYGPDFFAGVSVQQLTGSGVSFSRDAPDQSGRLLPHFFITGGYKFFLSEELAAMPSVMVKSVAPAPYSWDVNMKLAFRDKLWIGGGYRDKDSFSGMAGVNVGHLLNLSYSYDFTVSTLQKVSNGSHELVLGLLLNNRYRVSCPQRQF